jgi:SOS-response transcriptional repressor LexA
METEILNGDLALIRKQDGIDRDGQVAAVVFNDDETGTLKKVYRFKDHVELRPNNQNYPIKVVLAKDASQIRVCGVMKKLVRNF